MLLVNEPGSVRPLAHVAPPAGGQVCASIASPSQKDRKRYSVGTPRPSLAPCRVSMPVGPRVRIAGCPSGWAGRLRCNPRATSGLLLSAWCVMAVVSRVRVADRKTGRIAPRADAYRPVPPSAAHFGCTRVASGLQRSLRGAVRAHKTPASTVTWISVHLVFAGSG